MVPLVVVALVAIFKKFVSYMAQLSISFSEEMIYKTVILEMAWILRRGLET